MVTGPLIPGLTAVALSTTSISVLWENLPAVSQNTVRNYIVLVMRQEEVVFERRELFFFTRSVDVTGLSPGVRYEVVVSALFNSDVSGLNNTVMVTTDEEGE